MNMIVMVGIFRLCTSLFEINMEIRPYHNDDLNDVITLFQNTVHTVNIYDYSQEQVDVWAPDHVDLTEWEKTLSTHHTFVATKDSTIIGFGDIDHSGYLDRLYVHHDYLRQGVATKICDKLETMVEPHMTIRTHASITAKPFFENRGYKVIQKQYAVRKGIFLENYMMELTSAGKASQ